MSSHNLPYQLDEADMPRDQAEFNAVNAVNLAVAAPTVTVAGGEAGTVAIGIASDANDVALSKTSATNRTGITGVQAPALSLTGESGLVVTTIGSSDIKGVRFDSTGNGPRFLWRLPPTLNKSKPIYFYVTWTSHANAVGDRSITWQVRYELLKKASINILGTFPLGTLDTAIAAQAPSGGSCWFEETDPGVMNAYTIASDDKWMHFAVGMSAFDASFTENKFLLKVTIEYYRRWMPA